MQKQTRGVEKNGVTGQEREETPEKHGYRQQNGGRESSVAASSQDHVKGFGIVNKAEIDVFLELSCFLHDPADVGNLISGSSAFSKTSLNQEVHSSHIAEVWLGEF